MACNDKPTNCAPCQDCGTAPQPVLPRCQDVALTPGTYRNATVSVNAQGCISVVEAGTADPYTPDPCCAPLGGGGEGEQGLPGPKGDPGRAATVVVGTVTTGAAGTPATVQNVGSNTAAVFDFVIPRGTPGANGETTTGVTYSGPDMEIADGAIQELGINWPPVLLVQTTTNPSTIAFTATKSTSTGILTLALDMSAYDTALRAELQQQIDEQQLEVESLQTAVEALQTSLADMAARLDVCCPP